MTHNDTRELLAAVARAETAARYSQPSRHNQAGPALDCGAGPGSPADIAALVDALSPVHPVAPILARAQIEQLIAKGEASEDRIARTVGVAIGEVRAVRARMDALSA